MRIFVHDVIDSTPSAPTLQQMIDENARVLKAAADARETQRIHADQREAVEKLVAEAVDASPLNPHRAPAAPLFGLSLFRYRLGNSGRDPQPAARDGNGDLLSPRATFVRNLRSPARGAQ